MNSIGVSGVLAALLLLGTIVKGHPDGAVSFWKTHFTMTCPGESSLCKWYKGTDGTDELGNEKELTLVYNNKNNGHYHCKYTEIENTENEIKYHFYVKGKVCENCYELDGLVVVVGICVDLLVTGVVILLVYMWAKRNKSAKPTPTTKARPHAEGHTPRTGTPAQPQSSHYQQLNPQTRTQDPYSTVNRMG